MSRTAVARWAVSIALVPACGSADPNSPTADDRSAASGTVLVLAAASLTDVFAEMTDAFESTNPAIDVDVSFGASSSLAVQIEQGAPADVFASANAELMNELIEQDLIAGSPVVFATNSVTIAVPTDNPAAVRSLADFERSELLLGACAPQVPCGGYAAEVFRAGGVDASLDTRESDVRAVVSKLVEGELDAGIVYATDVSANAAELEAVALPDDIDVRTEYPVGLLADAPNTAAAQEFVDFVTSATGRSILTDAGFAAP